MLCLVALKWGKRTALLIGALFILGFVLRLYSWNHAILPLIDTDAFGLAWIKWMYYPTYNRLDGLLVGVSIAGLCQFYPKAKAFIAQYGNVLLLAGLALTGLAYYICLEPQSFTASIFGFPLVALAYGCILAAAISPRCFLYRFPLKATSSIAALSYSIYLTHKGIIHITQGQLSRWGIEKEGSLMFFLCLLTCLLGAWVMRHLVEKPFMRIRDRVLKRSNRL